MSMSIFLNLVIIEFVIVFIIDYSGFVGEIERYLGVFLRSRLPLKIPKPFSCSLCMTFWCGLIYLIIIHEFNFISLFILTILLTNTNNILHLIYTLNDLIESVLNKFDNFINWLKY